MNILFMRPLRHLFILFFFCSVTQVSGQYPTDSSKISILTLSPGSETYSAFGHSAIHVSDWRRGVDFAYNYGMFDFSTPNFYGKFIFGRLMYSLGISDYRDFFLSYKSWGQAMWEQELNLTNKEKWQLITNLQINYQMENRYYRYGFFRDNCSTRIRDIIEKSVDGKIFYDTAYIKKPYSFRQMMAECFEHRDLWSCFGMNLLLGKGADSIAGIRDYMYLPNNLMNLYTAAKISKGGVTRVLSQKPIELFPSTLTFTEPDPLTKPSTIFWILFMVVCGFTFWGYRKNKYFKWIDAFLFLIIGLLGLLFAVLMIGTLHSELQNNYNIVWANPVTLIFAVGLFIKSKPMWMQYLLIAYGILLVIFIPVSFLMTQVFPVEAYPLIGVLLVRVVRIVFKK